MAEYTIRSPILDLLKIKYGQHSPSRQIIDMIEFARTL